jgi:biopolymer transport protein ExbB/TolQ
MTERLVEVLYFLTSGLLLPLLVILVGCIANSLLTLGGLVREALDRRRVADSWRGFLARVRKTPAAAEDFYQIEQVGFVAKFQRETSAIRRQRLSVKKCLHDTEIAIGKRLGRLSIQTRVGPMLGLVGTLVPLGPALTGLASGDVHTLAGNLVIAFTTTILGILIGAFAYAVGLVRHAWYEQDMSDLEFVVDAMYAAADADEAQDDFAFGESNHA